MPLHPVGFWSDAGGGGTVTLSGETVNRDGTLDVVGIYVYGSSSGSQGQVDKREGSTYTQIDTTTDWVIPNSAAGDGYHIKCTITSDIGGDPGFTGGSGTGSWLSLTGVTSRFWIAEPPGPYGADSKDITFTLEISDDGGSTTLDSASYRIISGGPL